MVPRSIILRYYLEANGVSEDTILRGLTAAWERAKDRPFEIVGDFINLSGAAASIDPSTLPAESVSQSAVLASQLTAQRPDHVIGFHVYPGAGCGHAVVALATFTGWKGWRWLASFGMYGGWHRNQVRKFQGHQRHVIELLEFARDQVGCELVVSDPTGFYDLRNPTEQARYMLSRKRCPPP